MCSLCRSNPCIIGCPNYESKVICCCDYCEEKIYEGYEIWTDIDNNTFCSEECANKYYSIKQI